MTQAQMQAEATAEVALHAQADCTPVITGDIYGIIAKYRRATIHLVSTAYAYGDVVQLLTRNGHRYRCIEGGTRDSTEPTFPTSLGGRITDGTVLWVEDGCDYENIYDTRAAICEAWVKKAEMASNLVTQSSMNSKVEASNLQAQCIQRAREYAPLVLG